MNSFTDSLRGYCYKVHKRDRFTCVYCGLNGAHSFAAWLSLSGDHLLPTGHQDRNNPEYIVTACCFCNAADNRYFDHAVARGITFDGRSREELIAQRKPFVLKTRMEYQEFWLKHVQCGDNTDAPSKA